MRTPVLLVTSELLVDLENKADLERLKNEITAISNLPRHAHRFQQKDQPFGLEQRGRAATFKLDIKGARSIEEISSILESYAKGSALIEACKPAIKQIQANAALREKERQKSIEQIREYQPPQIF